MWKQLALTCNGITRLPCWPAEGVLFRGVSIGTQKSHEWEMIWEFLCWGEGCGLMAFSCLLGDFHLTGLQKFRYTCEARVLGWDPISLFWALLPVSGKSLSHTLNTEDYHAWAIQLKQGGHRMACWWGCWASGGIDDVPLNVLPFLGPCDAQGSAESHRNNGKCHQLIILTEQ